MSTLVKAYFTQGATTPLTSTFIQRRDPGAKDVVIDILYCGVCHSDIHQARNQWKNTLYPCIPGHEIVGRVMKVGTGVQKHREGEIVAVGCLVDSCRRCSSCREGIEQHCENGPIFTYNSQERGQKNHTFGGYSKMIVVDEDFVLKLPTNLDPAAAAPLLCAGITTYSPLNRYRVAKGQRVGIIGLGGLGHMGIKFASAMGCEVVLLTHSAEKEADGRRLGANEVILSNNPTHIERAKGSFDFLLNTIPVPHDLDMYLNLLRRSATMVLVGAPPTTLSLQPFSLIFQRRGLAGSLIGGIQETQEMLNFCSEKKITCDIERIAMEEINDAYEKMLRHQVKYRFVIDMGRF